MVHILQATKRKKRQREGMTAGRPSAETTSPFFRDWEKNETDLFRCFPFLLGLLTIIMPSATSKRNPESECFKQWRMCYITGSPGQRRLQSSLIPFSAMSYKARVLAITLFSHHQCWLLLLLRAARWPQQVWAVCPGMAISGGRGTASFLQLSLETEKFLQKCSDFPSGFFGCN